MKLDSGRKPAGVRICLCGLVTCMVLTSFSLSQSRSQVTRHHETDQVSEPELEAGTALAQKGELKGAEEAFERAVTLHPLDPRALTALGQVQEQLGELPESLEQFRKVIELDPLSADAHVNLGIALGDDSDLAGALKESSIAIRLAPGSASAHFLRGRLLSDLGKREEARVEFRKVLDITPGYAEALHYWAELEGDEGNLIAQGNLLSRYVKLRPEQATAFVELGNVWEQEHKESDAIVAWKRAIELNPQYAAPIYSLARALKRSDPSESRRLIERLSELNHDQQNLDRVKLLGNLANGKMNDANFRGAIDDLHQAIILCGTCEILGALEKNLGLAYCHAGQLDSGERELKLAETQIPKDRGVKVALQVLEQQRRQALKNYR